MFLTYCRSATTDRYGMLIHVYNLSRTENVPIVLRVTSTDLNTSLIVYVRLNAAQTPINYTWLITENKQTSWYELFVNPNDTFNSSQIYIGVQSASHGSSYDQWPFL